MHVCCESRDIVLNVNSGIRFRVSKAAGCPVPFRHYRPDFDTLYVGRHNHRTLCGAIEAGLLDRSVLSKARKVALELAGALPYEGLDNGVSWLATE
ncbi:hypothetical protein B0J13DRAFT_576281 [Dactylonectria estremocensis]|uniref:Uncharacterized protein n=1 Tax=Dactylonectria estremocensis TaxID=1079267 RepID=A0A9P9D3U7_9HYPO|nr:hypothetical protein B0J13DRAFT_576281 [Dactylonectria estremocensis]